MKTYTIQQLAATLSLVLCWQLTTPLAADEIVEILLSDRETESLLPEARKEYDLALEYFDQILYTECLTHLEKAAELDPKHVPIQFLTARFAIQLARNGNGYSLAFTLDNGKSDAELAGEYYAVADKYINRVKNIKDLPETYFNRVENLNQLINEERSKIAQREARRQEVSYRFLVEHAEEIYRAEKTEQPAPTINTRTVLGVPQNTDQNRNQGNTNRQRPRRGEPINPFRNDR